MIGVDRIRAGEAALWQHLCALLDDDPHLWVAVEASLEEADVDPWDELIGGLDDSGALAYLDAEDTGMELSDALAQLPRVFALQPDLDEVNDIDDLDEAMRTADAVLDETEFRLVELEDADDDAHALVVVHAESVPDIVRIAAALGHPVVLPRG